MVQLTLNPQEPEKPTLQIVLVLARSLFSGVCAVAAGVAAWRATRSPAEAAVLFDKTMEHLKTSQDANLAAVQLSQLVPFEVIHSLELRAAKCWTGYRQVLDGNYLPQAIDEATESVQACVCQELGRIYALSGHMPDRWAAQWDLYKCKARLKV
jgi:hypothetical protein